VRRSALLLLACFAACAAAAACVDGGRASVTIEPPDATADDASAGDDVLDAGPDLVVSSVCGSPPWVTLGIHVVALTLDNTDGSPLPGARFTASLCPGVVQYSDDAGLLQGSVSRDVPFYGRLTAPNYISELAPEEVFDADSTSSKIEMLPTIVEGLLLPGYDASASSAIVVSVQKTVSDAGACSSIDGVTLGVAGHPEAQVTYFSNATIPMAVPGATATTTSGLAAITGLSAGDAASYVTLTATKPGCHAETQHGSQTGRVPLETGYVSLMAVYLGP
jgi:hypothetical protein